MGTRKAGKGCTTQLPDSEARSARDPVPWSRKGRDTGRDGCEEIALTHPLSSPHRHRTEKQTQRRRGDRTDAPSASSNIRCGHWITQRPREAASGAHAHGRVPPRSHHHAVEAN
eukprot:6541948-Prymnesium_polylepis.1